MMLLTLMSTSSLAHTQPLPSSSLSLEAAVVAPRLDHIAVHGEGFTPGGLVELTLSGDPGTGLDRQMWAVASTESFGPHSSADPAQGYIPGGTIDEVIAAAPEDVYGPNGSQDPAQGYIDQSQERVRVPLCFQDFTVQALDVQSGSVSALVKIHATCSVAAQPPIAGRCRNQT